jgi:hypothetical protein
MATLEMTAAVDAVPAGVCANAGLLANATLARIK